MKDANDPCQHKTLMKPGHVDQWFCADCGAAAPDFSRHVGAFDLTPHARREELLRVATALHAARVVGFSNSVTDAANLILAVDSYLTTKKG